MNMTAPAPLGQRIMRQTGVSLVELMVAMALGLVLVATIGAAYLGAQSSFRSQNALSLMQENARYAFQLMSEDIRMAGFSGGPVTGGTQAVVAPATWDPNLMHLFSDEADTTGAPLIGYEGGVSAFPTGVAPLTGDAITVVHADDENEYRLDTAAAQAAPTYTLSTWPTTSESPPQVGELFVVSNYTHAAVFQVLAVDSAARTVTADNNSGTVAPGSSSALGTFYSLGSAGKLYRLKGVTYYIANNAAGEPSLYRLRLTHSGTDVATTAEELVEGVSNMTIEYGVDTDNTADSNVNAYWTADQVTAGTDTVTAMPASAATTQDRWARVLSVRITLTMQSKSNERVTTSGQQMSRSFTTTIAVRNRLL